MKITVFGGSGFLGSHVADKLSTNEHKVTIFDKKKSKWIKSNQNFILGDILDKVKAAGIAKRDVLTNNEFKNIVAEVTTA